MSTATEVEVDWTDVEAAAKLCANNHASIQNFLWFSEPKDSDRYFLWYISSRDANLVEESNAAVIEKEMLDCPGVSAESHSHWGPGYLNCLVVPVYRKDRKTITKAFKKVCELKARLEAYGLLDDADHSRREYESTLQSIEQEGQGLVKGSAPDNWTKEVWQWLWDHDEKEVRSRDDQGGYPSKEALKKALTALKMLDPAESDAELDDFPIGSRVLVGESDKTSNTFWNHSFEGIVDAHDVDWDMLIVRDGRGETFAVMPGEIEEFKLNDPEQLRLFYFMSQTQEYYTWEEWLEWKNTYKELTTDE